MPTVHQRQTHLVGDVRYRLIFPFAWDDLGELWRGERVPGGEPVTVRVLANHLAADIRFLTRLDKELRRQHSAAPIPGISRVLDHSRRGQTPVFIVMEPTGTRTLAQSLDRGDRSLSLGARSLVSAVDNRLVMCREAGIPHGRIRARSIVLPSWPQVGIMPSGITLIDLPVEAALFETNEMQSQGQPVNPLERRSRLALTVWEDLDTLLRQMTSPGTGGIEGGPGAGPEIGVTDRRSVPRIHALRGRRYVPSRIEAALRQVRSRSHVATPWSPRRGRGRVVIGWVIAGAMFLAAAAGLAVNLGYPAPRGLDRNLPASPRGESVVQPHDSEDRTNQSPGIRVPSVVGLSALQAWRRITEAGLTLATVVPVEGTAGRVMRTAPRPGGIVAPGAAVTLYAGSATDRFPAESKPTTPARPLG